MSVDPHRPHEPFNRFYDVARLRNFRPGLRTGALLGGHGVERRDVIAIECKTDRSILVEPVIGGDLHHAAGRMLARLPAGGR